MERLTYWNEEYGCWSYKCASGDAAKCLAAYEDTGLTPEQIQAQQQEIDRLKAIITDSVAEIDALEMTDDTGISDGLYTAMREAIGLDVAVDSSGEVRQRLKADLYDKLVQIAGLIADKDEQAGRIMQLENGLKDAKRALKEADYIAHGGITCLICEEIKAIDALLGGKDSYPCTDHECFNRGNYHTGCESCSKHKGGGEG